MKAASVELTAAEECDPIIRPAEPYFSLDKEHTPDDSEDAKPKAENQDPAAALGHNAQGHFDCRWVVLDPSPRSHSVWTKGLDDPIHCPIAHGEGRYVHPDPASLDHAGQVALRYRSTNPNGSVADIAGVSDPSGVVLGLMPHPENHIVARQHPHHSRGGGGPAHLGLRLFENGVRHAKSL